MAKVRSEQGNPGAGSNNNAHSGAPQETKLQSVFGTSGKFYQIQSIPGIGEAIGLLKTAEETTAGGAGGYKNVASRIAGVAQIKYIPVIGVASDLSDPVNVAGQRIYNDIQMAMKSRNLPFDAVDVMKVLLCIDSIYSMWHIIHRAYRTLGQASYTNRYVPEALFKAYACDYTTFRANKAQMLEDLGMWRASINAYIAAPKKLKLFEAHQQMLECIYADDAHSKTQLYVCCPENLWDYQNADTNQRLNPVAVLAATDFDGTTAVRTYTQWSTMLDAAITALRDSTDYQKIVAALHTTYADSDMYQLPDVADTSVPVYYDENFYTTLENASVFERSVINMTEFAPDWSGNTNIIKCNPTCKVARYEASYAGDNTIKEVSGTYLTTSLMDTAPDGARMTNAMRWRALVFPNTDAGAGVNAGKVTSMGPEFITGIRIIGIGTDAFYAVRNTTDGTDTTVQQDFTIHTNEVIYLENSVAYQSVYGSYYMAMWHAKLALLRAFDHLPPIFIHMVAADPQAGKNFYYRIPSIHWHYPAQIGTSDLRSYHRAMLWASYIEEGGTGSAQAAQSTGEQGK